mgnify:CR=1 FL=1
MKRPRVGLSSRVKAEMKEDTGVVELSPLYLLDMRVFMTVAMDLVLGTIREPVRFTLETKARIYPRSERFWYFSKRVVKEQFYMHLKQVYRWHAVCSLLCDAVCVKLMYSMYCPGSPN